MKVTFAALCWALAASQSFAVPQERRAQFGEVPTEAPTVDSFNVEDTPSPTGFPTFDSAGLGDTPGDTEQPTVGVPQTDSPAPSPTDGTEATEMPSSTANDAISLKPTAVDDTSSSEPTVTEDTVSSEAPTDMQPSTSGSDGTPEPTPFVGFETPVPTETTEETDAPSVATPEPTFDTVVSTRSPTPSPSSQPTKVYVPPEGDDPFAGDENDENTDGWKDNDYESLQEMERDRNVIIALSTVFGVGVVLALITAHQMLENPSGICASLCRIFVACFCGLLRCVCFPCRMMCGCTNKNQRTHELVENDFATHDLELS